MDDRVMTMFLGLSVEGWKLLQEYHSQFLAKVPDGTALLEENARLRGQLEFVKSRMAQIERVLK